MNIGCYATVAISSFAFVIAFIFITSAPVDWATGP